MSEIPGWHLRSSLHSFSPPPLPLPPPPPPPSLSPSLISNLASLDVKQNDSIPSGAPVPNKPTVSVDVKQHSTNLPAHTAVTTTQLSSFQCCFSPRRPYGLLGTPGELTTSTFSFTQLLGSDTATRGKEQLSPCPAVSVPYNCTSLSFLGRGNYPPVLVS